LYSIPQGGTKKITCYESAASAKQTMPEKEIRHKRGGQANHPDEKHIGTSFYGLTKKFRRRRITVILNNP
jgi:hypothetical protein